jgi:hypothetical protein
MKYFIILALVLLTGCIPFKQVTPIEQVVTDSVTIDQPIIQPTTSITQYDYKAGEPNVYTEPLPLEQSIPNRYLLPEQYQPITDYFKPMKPAAPQTWWIPRWDNNQ